MARANQALGMIEVKGFITLLEASDAMMKAANVEFVQQPPCDIKAARQHLEFE